jgi:hypothetical protein
MKTPKGTKPRHRAATAEASAYPTNVIECGVVIDIKLGVAEMNAGTGMVVQFMPDIKPAPIAFVIAPHMAVAMRKKLESMEKEFGWTETTVSQAIVDALAGKETEH